MASILTPGETVPFLPLNGEYYSIIDRRFESSQEAFKMAEALTKRFNIHHRVMSCFGDVMKGRLRSVNLNVASSQDRDVTILDEDNTHQTWRDAEPGDILVIHVMPENPQEHFNSKYPWFDADDLSLEDVKVTQNTKLGGSYSLEGRKTDASQFASFLDL